MREIEHREKIYQHLQLLALTLCNRMMNKILAVSHSFKTVCKLKGYSQFGLLKIEFFININITNAIFAKL
jgi:hypothetical protein